MPGSNTASKRLPHFLSIEEVRQSLVQTLPYGVMSADGDGDRCGRADALAVLRPIGEGLRASEADAWLEDEGAIGAERHRAESRLAHEHC